MGLLYLRRDEDTQHSAAAAGPASDQHPGESSSNSIIVAPTLDPWLVVVIVIGILIVATLAICMLVHCIQSRRQRAKWLRPVKEAEKRTSVGAGSWNRKPSPADRQRAEDLERDMMIRKSLASRPTSASVAQEPRPSAEDCDGEEQDQDQDQGELASLREDWKAWEARVQSERTAHPGGVGLDRHPAFAAYLSIPQPTRMPSPGRGGGAGRRF